MVDRDSGARKLTDLEIRLYDRLVLAERVLVKIGGVLIAVKSKRQQVLGEQLLVEGHQCSELLQTIKAPE